MRRYLNHISVSCRSHRLATPVTSSSKTSRTPYAARYSTPASHTTDASRRDPPLLPFNQTVNSKSIKPFFLTTPIFYVNASPHIGHLHSLLLADVIARFSRLRYTDRQVVFTTGTDEHGLKIQQAAKAQGVGEEEFCQTVSERFRDLAKKANVSHTDFIRTSEARHYRAVEHFWNKLVESGDIYKGTHSGWYSISDECFYSASQVKPADGDDGKMVSIESGSEVIWEEEENWKFRLGKYRHRISEWANGYSDPVLNPSENHSEHNATQLLQVPRIHPPKMASYITAQLATLEDLSISRPASRVRWGVPVPNDRSQTIYVWVDALINYITVLGYPEDIRGKGWPVDVHVVGKDIIRFHAVHWPALLMSAGLPPPRSILAHAHWTMGRSKMSKSRGNVVDPIGAMDTYGVDGARWYLLRVGGSLPDDADYSDEQLHAEYRILSSQMGNLLSRISTRKMIDKIKEWNNAERNPELDKMLSRLPDEYEDHMNQFRVDLAGKSVMDVISEANKMFTHTEPWRLKNATVPITYVYHTLRIAAILLRPFMPDKSEELLDRLGVPEIEWGWKDVRWAVDGDVNTEKLIRDLRRGLERWKGKGVLFGQIKREEGGL